MNPTVTYTNIQDNISLVKQLIQEGHYTQALEECSANLENESSFDDFNLSSQLYTYRALAYYKISCFEEALSDATQALEGLKKCSKEMNDTKIKLFLVFGKVYTSRADYKEALNILNEGLGFAKDFPGEDSLDSARYHCSIGRVYTEIGEETQATEHLDQCSNILSKNQQNKEYNHEIVSYNYAHGKLCEYQRRLKNGMDVYTRACEILISLYSVNHPDLFPVYCGLGNCCFGQEDYTSANEWYVKALEIAQKNFPEKHLTYSVCYYSFGNIYLEKGIYKTAEEFYNQALEIKEKYFPHLQHPDIAKLKFNLSIVYLEQNKLNKALEVLEHAESIFIEKFKQDHKLSVKCLHNKAKIFETQGKLGLAFPIFKQALAKYKLIYGSDEIEIGECYISIGKILYEQGKYKEAVDNYFEGLRIIQSVLGSYSFNVGRILFNIGLCHLMLKNYESGEKMFIRANQIYRGKSSPEKNPEEALLTERIERRIQSLSVHTLKLASSTKIII